MRSLSALCRILLSLSTHQCDRLETVTMYLCTKIGSQPYIGHQSDCLGSLLTVWIASYSTVAKECVGLSKRLVCVGIQTIVQFNVRKSSSVNQFISQ